MEKQPLKVPTASSSRPQWSLWALLITTAVVAACLGAWRFHFLVGFMLTLFLLPALILFAITRYLKVDAEKATPRAIGIFILLGATLTPLVALSLGPFGSISEIAERLAGLSFIGGFLAVGYTGYVLLMAKLLEMLFGPPRISK